jgi:hypothetical protein
VKAVGIPVTLSFLLVATAAARPGQVVAPADRKQVAAVGIWSLGKRVKLVRLSYMKKKITDRGIRFRTSYRLKVGRRELKIPKVIGLFLNGQALLGRAPERFYGNEALVDRYHGRPLYPPGAAPKRMVRGDEYAGWH